jgi:hypothetical protein
LFETGILVSVSGQSVSGEFWVYSRSVLGFRFAIISENFARP